MAFPDINLPGITQPMAAWHFAVSFQFFKEKTVKLSSPGGPVPMQVLDVPGTLLSNLFDFRFTEVSGIGFNVAATKLTDKVSNIKVAPGEYSYTSLNLKRALITNSPLSRWADQWRTEEDANGNGLSVSGIIPIVPAREKANVVVLLLGPNHLPIMGWSFSNAWPSSYKISALNAKADELVWEEITLTFESYTTLELSSIQFNPNSTIS
jgi:phage tail-like protein